MFRVSTAAAHTFRRMAAIAGLVLLSLATTARDAADPSSSHLPWVTQDAAGNPLGGVTVTIYKMPWRPGLALETVAVATTDGQGGCVFELPDDTGSPDPYQWIYVFTHPDFGIQVQSGSQAMQRYPNPSEAVVLPAIARASVSGQVHDPAGAPVAGATVRAGILLSPSMPGSDLFFSSKVSELSTITDAAGAFTIGGLATDQRVVLRAEHPAAGFAIQIEAPPAQGPKNPNGWNAIQAGTAGINLSLQPWRSISGQVLAAESGDPVPNATVIAMPSVYTFRAIYGYYETTSDAEGNYRFAKLDSNRYQIRANSAARRLGSVQVVIEESTLAHSFDVMLPLAARIEGRFVPESETIDLAALTLQVHADCQRAYDPQPFQQADASGAFSVLVAPGLATFEPMVQGAAEFMEARPRYRLVLQPGTTRDLLIPLRSMPVFRGRVADETGAVVTGAVIEPLLGYRRDPVYTGDDGRFTIPFRLNELEFGKEIRIQVTHGEAPRRRGFLSTKFMTEDEAHGEIILRPEASAHGTALSRDGEVLPDFEVGLWYQPSERLHLQGPKIRSDTEGRFSFTGLIPEMQYVFTNPSKSNVFVLSAGEDHDLGTVYFSKPLPERESGRNVPGAFRYGQLPIPLEVLRTMPKERIKELTRGVLDEMPEELKKELGLLDDEGVEP